MKKALLILSAALLFAAASCNKASSPGSLEFSIASNDYVADDVKGKLSDIIALPDTKAFSIVIKNDGGETVWSGLLSEWSAANLFPVGKYSVSASYGTSGEEGIGKPYFSGSTNFSIAGAETTKVKIPVELQNCIIKVVCTESFNNYFPDYQFTVKTGANNTFVISKGSTDSYFIEAYKFTVSGELTNQGGTVQTFEKIYENLEAANYYTLKFDASNIGGFKVTVTFKDDVTTVDLGDVELNN